MQRGLACKYAVKSKLLSNRSRKSFGGTRGSFRPFQFYYARREIRRLFGKIRSGTPSHSRLFPGINPRTCFRAEFADSSWLGVPTTRVRGNISRKREISKEIDKDSDFCWYQSVPRLENRITRQIGTQSFDVTSYHVIRARTLNVLIIYCKRFAR